MGFETYLHIDDAVLLTWRKHASPLPRLLFRFEDLFVESGVNEDGDPVIDVGYRAAASDVLASLERAGLGWRAAVAAYADNRLSGVSAGIMMAMTLKTGDMSHKEAQRQFDSFEALPADQDLLGLGELMMSEWRDDECNEVSLLGDLTFDGDLPDAHDAAFGVWQAAEKRGITNPFAAARAAESLALLDRTAPMLAWPLVVCVFLRQLPSDSLVELVLTEDAVVNEDVHDEVSAREYATTYWSGASESLAQQARTLERLFAVLAGSNEGAGAEFWFARASDLLERVQSLTSTTDDDDLTTRARGDALESLVDALMRTEEPELRVIEKNLRTTEEEIDLVLKNGLSDAFWSTLSSPLILVECKNWSRRAGVETLRVFESKMQDRGALCRIGIFVSMAGFTEPFLTRLKVIQAEGGVIFAVDGRDLATLVTSKRRISDWLGDEGLRRSLGASTI